MDLNNNTVRGGTYYLDVILTKLIQGYCRNSSPTEFKVIIFVLLKTLLSGQQTAPISLNNFVQETGLSKPTILKVLKELLDDRVIYRFEKCTPYEYGVNYLTLFGIEGLQKGQGFYHISNLSLKNTEVETDSRLSYGKDYL